MSKEVRHYQVDLADLLQIEGYKPQYRVGVPNHWSFRFTNRKSMQDHWDWCMLGADKQMSRLDHPARRKRPLIIEMEDCIVKLTPRE